METNKIYCGDSSMVERDLFNEKEYEWEMMPEFFPPTRNTKLRNSYDISDVVYKNTHTKTSFFPKYPIYIVSKGRWDTRLTSKALDRLEVPYKIVVEPQDYNKYVAVMQSNKILTLPFSNLEQGSIPARNWIWEHSIKEGHKRHWILDDNIDGFGTQKYGRRINILYGDFFYDCEKFIDRYENVALAGIRYRFHHNYVKKPYFLNTRIYSCILINNNIPFRWRGKYNEDTDLSLRVLKAGYCTVLFTWCYCNKVASMTMKGGNTDTIYNTGDERLAFAESLVKQHPDVCQITRKFNRWHHQVSYKKFKKNMLVLAPVRTPGGTGR